MPVADVTDADFATQVIERSREVPVVVDFWAAWCGPCRMLTPVMEKVANEPEAGFELAKVDVDANPKTASQMQVRAMPTLLVVKNGAVVGQLVGRQPKDKIKAIIAPALG